MGETFSIPGVYRRPKARAEGFPRVRTDIAGFVGAAGPMQLNQAVAVDDWKSYVARFRQDARGRPVPPPPGGALDPAVRDFFANGGRRLWIVNVAEAVDPDRTQEFLNDMLGIGGSLDPHGLELLLRQDEVSLVALPDLDAVETTLEDAGDEAGAPGDPCFRRCGTVATAGGALTAPPRRDVVGRLYGDDDRMWAQRYLIERLRRESWRWFAILTPPPGSNPDAAVGWRRRLTAASEGADIAALYWPWLLVQETPGAPVETRSPVGAVTGVFAASDIAEGPHRAPANLGLTGAVGLDVAVGDAENRTAYDAGVNVIRGFPGRGILIWGARTLLWQDETSRGEPLAFVNARRCLSAIARSAWVVGQPLVFQPNTAIPRIRLHQLMTDYLLRVFAAGALMGDTPDQGFFVEVEPAEVSPEGQLVCRIGVALAAPAEFIVFRIGRESGVIEFAEAA
jgi:uncharacterized protein